MRKKPQIINLLWYFWVCSNSERNRNISKLSTGNVKYS